MRLGTLDCQDAHMVLGDRGRGYRLDWLEECGSVGLTFLVGILQTLVAFFGQTSVAKYLVTGDHFMCTNRKLKNNDVQVLVLCLTVSPSCV